VPRIAHFNFQAVVSACAIILYVKILGIETSCDETAVAVVEDPDNILTNVVSSQVDIHRRYGGIVPEVASRQHLITILPVLQSAMAEAKISWHDVDAVAVTVGPGLAGSLLVGVNVAKSISMAYSLPLIGVNHLEAHIYANWLSREKPVFPCLCLIVSGGHSDMLLMTGHGQFQKLGRTRDDAAGEAFDKAARILELGYPGGPVIEKAAAGHETSFQLPRAWLRGTDDFSFSGLKTAVLHLARDNDFSDPKLAAEAAASFQEAVVDVLVGKTVQTAERLGVKQILLCGGVASNKALRDGFSSSSPMPVLMPPPILCTDNAAMVAACSYYRLQRGEGDGWDVDVIPGLSLG
jgi:N6-L-threonylcarbamoyladenine synthase